MMTREEGDGFDVVPFHQWKQLKSPSLTTDLDCSKDGHNIVCKSTAEEEGLAVDCAFCEKQVMRSDYYYYYCKGCSLALHKDCAESSDPKTKEDMNYACRTCKGKGEGYEECRTCAFEMYLRNRERPTAISHVDTEEHLLLTSGVLAKGFYDQYRCVACGNFSSVWSLYLCTICDLAYHYECVTLPRRVEHEHGLHHHHLSLKYTSEEAEEDYLCNQCNEFRDPGIWFYSCEDCTYELHLFCVYKELDVLSHR